MDNNEFKPTGRTGTKKPEVMNNEELIKAILDSAWSKNGFDTKVYDVSGVVDYADAFVILSGRSDRHVMAVAEAIEVRMKELGNKPSSVEGRKSGSWVLLDFGNVVVHVFEKHSRAYYDLDRLWVDARPVEVTEPEWVSDFARMEADQFD